MFGARRILCDRCLARARLTFTFDLRWLLFARQLFMPAPRLGAADNKRVLREVAVTRAQYA